MARRPHIQEENPYDLKIKNVGVAESLNFFNTLCHMEDNLSMVFNKLNDLQYTSGIINL